nr:hypothetical protein [Actinomycetota bacterium]
VVQGAGALTGRLALTSPAGFAARALIALAAEAILAALTITWLHRSPAPHAGTDADGKTDGQAADGQAVRHDGRGLPPG